MHIGEKKGQLERGLEDTGEIFVSRSSRCQHWEVLLAQSGKRSRTTRPESAAKSDADLTIADVAGCPNKTFALPLRIFDIVATDMERIPVKAQEITYT
jgi:hypothetical protein